MFLPFFFGGAWWIVLMLLAVLVVARAVDVILARGGVGTLVRVPVDDLATGNLPGICVKTGEPSDTFVYVEGSDEGFQPWWLLLLLAGPIGIAVIVALWAFGRRANRVGGDVPLADAAVAAYNTAVRASRLALLVAFAGMVVGVAAVIAAGQYGPAPGWAEPVAVAGLVAVCLGIGASGVGSALARRRWIGVDLDGSARWAVLRNVHPAFAAAVRERYRAASRSENEPEPA